MHNWLKGVTRPRCQVHRVFGSRSSKPLYAKQYPQSATDQGAWLSCYLKGFGATRLPTRPAKRRKAPEGHETVLRNAPTHFQEPAHKNVNVDSPSLGFPYFNFLGEAQCKKTPCMK